MDINDTVLKLKERILEADTGLVSSSLTWSKLTVRYKGQELEDSRRLREYEVSEDSEMEVRVRKVKRMNVFVQSKCETKKIPVWVNPSDNVEVLKPLLKKMNEEYDFPLPPEYFFIHKQDVMDNDKSFRWNRVAQGDIIDVFPGSVISG
ncbi:hypothetical protein TIFTF001_018980 [Ficus carica]|uniref:Ubiquitin-like domain-containing protein n=1 Tax=Ficus carica TaxID=3494 RepID=A0AA88A841_FICCA|nr:hypothetical protein TIFTF001_018980 [Ficus carica]